jgi:UDP-2,3-diacylglucosamine hydrolase
MAAGPRPPRAAAAAASAVVGGPLSAGIGAPATTLGSPGSLPALFEFNVPDNWHAIDFISDLHLCDRMPRTFDAWASHLRGTQADAVFILGDLFEAWVGDDARTQPFERRCVDVLADAASHRQMAFMVGNRDFLFGSAALSECGLLGLSDPTLLNAWGQRVLLSHGDALCLADTTYQGFRKQVRMATWQTMFLAKPLAERLGIAEQLRSASATRQQFDGDASIDIDTCEAVRWMHALGAQELVHGHTHRPGSNALAPGFIRHVLSDWDLDPGPHNLRPRAEVLRLTRDGFVRMAPTAA